MRVYQAIPAMIEAEGINVVFGLFGSANVSWVGHGVDHLGLTWIGVRHEGTAVSAAAAHAKVTGSVTVASTTLGPGFANTVNSLAAAAHDHAPVVLITGQSPSSKMHGDFQTLNQREIVDALGVGFHEAHDTASVETAFYAAMNAARWNGLPQVISLAEDILDTEIELHGIRPEQTERDDIDPDAVHAIVDLLERAEHPVILAGRGAALSGCKAELVELADLVGARVSNTLAVNRYFAGHPYDLGVCGKSSSPAVAEELQHTDAVLAVGASLNSFTTSESGIFPHARIAQCELDIERDFKASAPELGLLGDARDGVQALISEWRARGLDSRTPRRNAPSWAQMRASVQRADLGHDPMRGLDPRDVYAWFDDHLPQDRIVLSDGGRAGIPLPALVNAPDDRSWLTTRGYGSIGLGIHGAIGAAVAAPDRPVVLFCGDGGFMAAAQELDTIRYYGLNVTIVILDDEQYGSEMKYLNRWSLSRDVARQDMPDVELLARAFGGQGVVVRTTEELEAVDHHASGLYIVDAKIDPLVDPANL